MVYIPSVGTEPVLVRRSKAQFARHKAEVEACFDGAHKSVYFATSLEEAIRQNRATWHLTTVAVPAIIELLLCESRLRVVDLASESYGSVRRYAWGALSPLELALSLKPDSYLSYGTAAYLRGLLPESPTTFHVNKEQSPKEQLGTLTQEGLDRAFSARPRQSKLIFSDQEGHRYVVIAGKFSNHLGVSAIKGPAGERLYATKVERTLIDITVRPIYAGGVAKVLEAYRASRDGLSAKRLMATLRKLDHLYPYHQAVGFYLERAGFDGEAPDLARRPGLEFDFYLTHGMDDTVYDKAWRLHHPRGL
jgi:hypothetical protein